MPEKIDRSHATNITKETVEMLRTHTQIAGGNHLAVIALVMGALFAFMTEHINPKDCREIVKRAMLMIGWGE